MNKNPRSEAPAARAPIMAALYDDPSWIPSDAEMSGILAALDTATRERDEAQRVSSDLLRSVMAGVTPPDGDAILSRVETAIRAHYEAIEAARIAESRRNRTSRRLVWR